MGERRVETRTLTGRLVVVGKSLVRCADALHKRQAAGNSSSLKSHLSRTAIQICALVREILSERDEPLASVAVKKALHELYLKSGGDDLEGSERNELIRDAVVDLRGEGRILPIPEILGFVSSLQRSGVLWVHGSVESFLVQVSGGQVVFAQGDSPPPGQRIGEILVARGATSSDEIDRVLRTRHQRDRLLGRTLVQEGVISSKHLLDALSDQVQLIFHRLFAAQDAHFEFLSGMTKVSEEDVRLNVTQLLLESARTTDELVGPSDLTTAATV